MRWPEKSCTSGMGLDAASIGNEYGEAESEFLRLVERALNEEAAHGRPRFLNVTEYFRLARQVLEGVK